MKQVLLLVIILVVAKGKTLMEDELVISVQDMQNPENYHFIVGQEPMTVLHRIVTSWAAKLGSQQPADIFPCFQNDYPQGWVNFIGTFLKKGANVTPFTLQKLLDYVNDFLENIPEPTKQCFRMSSDVTDYKRKLGILGKSLDEVKKIAEKNILNHLFKVINYIKSMNRHFESGQFEQVGEEAVPLLKFVLQ